MQHPAEATGKAEAADGAEVVHRNAARKSGIVVHMHVPAEQRSVGHDDAVADTAVVSDMTARHDVAMAAERRNAVFLLGATIDRHTFADQVVIADHHLRIAAAIADVLRIAPDDSHRKNAVMLADRDTSHDGDVVQQASSAADAGLGADDAQRADLDVVVQLRSRIDDRTFVDVDRHGSNSRWLRGRRINRFVAILLPFAPRAAAP